MDLLAKVEELSGEKLYACYQCGKCSAGCPMVEEMDLLPNQVILYVMRGNEKVLEAKTPWVCAQCYQCGTRCPREVLSVRDKMSKRGRHNKNYGSIAKHCTKAKH